MPTVKDFFQLRRTFVIVLFIGLFAMAARNVLDPDVWWHLKTGEWIVQHRAVPHTDPFSYTRAGQPWTVHEWLCQVAIYGLFRWTGYTGLIIAFAAIISAAFFPLYLRCRAGPVASAAMTAWGALATAVVWGVRPQILSLLLLSVWLLILERSEKNPGLLWLTLPLTVLWVNLHGGVILGPAFLGLFIAGEFLETFFPPNPHVTIRLRWLSLALVADLALIPMNPNGASILWYPTQTMRVQSHISEWASPNFHSADYAAFFLLLLATFAALIVSRRRVRPRDIILLLATLTAALSSVRMIPLFVLIAVPIVARPLGDWLATSNSAALRPRSQFAFLNVGIVVAMIVFAAIHTSQVIRRQPQAEATHFPAAAAAYLQQDPPAGNIFNHYDWGGYLIFKLYPQTRVFTDGRTEVYGESMMQEFVRAYYLQDSWQQPLLKWKVTTVIVPPDSALASALRESRDWSLSYQDSVGAIFSKSFNYSALQSNLYTNAASLPPKQIPDMHLTRAY
jgi:hypothetical protein